MTQKLSEPQQLLVTAMKTGSTLTHSATNGLFRLTKDGKGRTVHPATALALINSGVIVKGATGACFLQEQK